ncbi:MAG: LytTR family DNA-binding domain-containing protein [Chitinophagaceae bacterium]
MSVSTRPPNKDLGKLVISSLNGIIIEDIQHIVWLESGKSGVTIHLTTNKSHIDYQTSQAEYHTRLVNSNFFLVHESRLVNITHVKSYHQGEGKTVMNNEAVIYVAERKRAPFKVHIGERLR